MSITGNRRERERAQRHRLILSVARELAEAEGWEAVTTRRLAERVEYSQPVLYSHFKGKDAIVAAVAEQGFTELAELLGRERAAARGDEPRLGLRAVCRAYLRFAVEHPALYQAMFVMPTQLAFAAEETPPALRAAFDVFVEALPEGIEGREARAELLWAALHGISALSATGRVPALGESARLDLLIDGIAPGGQASRSGGDGL
ncbi:MULTISPECIES: TetR/AcrR family transcriptional regulator [unclassified Streptomyces]|uniref:TetR/AcrR family transcriptional regulator n=1 Tax=Streptomyces TaxID=1883 RepID=UPI0001C1CA35|nr:MULTISPECIES: TetR/AcrR family transcriptional regulator [unclassified Streptomyces]AEN12371.1 transcriptional regulator, TetR family [Streptomyces sp. SirexAA-E]MYR69761.1 TetR family transcriptional regulator [Streptomyces sp. SID4939]MYS04355.1 TetR family transcriptional regulator [Streptomyces sp. SID4940]MYT63089.1 TetR family transcriptional regulator [Streptomyces sp. SID8357]MYT88635.1 TetR family transcriptional regulator [Streptomyces sp. SID8360]